MNEQKTAMDNSETEKILHSLRPLNDRQKSAQTLFLTRDIKEDAFDRVAHPRKSNHSIYSFRDFETNSRHVHRSALKRSDTLRSLTQNYEGLINSPLGMGSFHLNTAQNIKSLNLSTDKCKNLPAGVLSRNLNPEELYIKLVRTKIGECLGKRTISFIRRNRSNLRWLKLTFKGDSNSKSKIQDFPLMKLSRSRRKYRQRRCRR